MISKKRIAEFREIANSFGPDTAKPNRKAFNTIHSLLNGLEDDSKTIADLEAIVDKLPKDAEGVHCHPGDRRWALTHPGGGEEGVLLGTVMWLPSGEWRIRFGMATSPVLVCWGYDTEEAAEAAKEEACPAKE